MFAIYNPPSLWYFVVDTPTDLRHRVFPILTIFNITYNNNDWGTPVSACLVIAQWIQRWIWGIGLLLGHRTEEKGWKPTTYKSVVRKGKLPFLCENEAKWISATVEKILFAIFRRGVEIFYWHCLLLRKISISVLCFRRYRPWWLLYLWRIMKSKAVGWDQVSLPSFVFSLLLLLPHTVYSWYLT